jgi:uncharacterized protein
MSENNSQNNRAVWFDISVTDLDRSIRFYAAVLAIEVSKEQMGDFSMGVFEHRDGNGACLMVNEAGISSSAGILVYMNTDGRIQDAVEKVESLGGKILEPIHAIGPHGFRAIVLDSEGNRIALHSCTHE